MRDAKRLVRVGYERVAERYLATRGAADADVRLLDDLLPRLPCGARVLDAGCGAGVPVTRRLSEMCRVTGADFARAQLRLAQAHVSEAQFVCADIAALGFAAGAFDAIVSYYAIIHVPRAEHRALLQDFARLLRAGGLALLCLGGGDTAEGYEDDWLGAPMFWSHYDAETNVQLVRECGFEVLWVRPIADALDAGAVHIFVLARKS